MKGLLVNGSPVMRPSSARSGATFLGPFRDGTVWAGTRSGPERQSTAASPSESADKETVTASDARTPSLRAFRIAVPDAAAVISPPASMLATFELLLAYAVPKTAAVTSLVDPPVNLAVTANCAVCPTAVDTVEEDPI